MFQFYLCSKSGLTILFKFRIRCICLFNKCQKDCVFFIFKVFIFSTIIINIIGMQSNVGNIFLYNICSFYSCQKQENLKLHPKVNFKKNIVQMNKHIMAQSLNKSIELNCIKFCTLSVCVYNLTNGKIEEKENKQQPCLTTG